MPNYTTTTPEWAVQGNQKVMSGVDATDGINPALLSGKSKPKHKMILSEDDYVDGVIRGDRMTFER